LLYFDFAAIVVLVQNKFDLICLNDMHWM